jgi:hypothetical protein
MFSSAFAEWRVCEYKTLWESRLKPVLTLAFKYWRLISSSMLSFISSVAGWVNSGFWGFAVASVLEVVDSGFVFSVVFCAVLLCTVAEEALPPFPHAATEKDMHSAVKIAVNLFIVMLSFTV